MLVLGLDLAFRNTGYIFYDGGPLDGGVITTKKEKGYVIDSDIQGCLDLAEGLRTLLERNPDYVVVEIPTGASISSRASRSMGLATGVAVAVLGDPVWISPAETKKLIKSIDEPDPKKRMSIFITQKFPDFNQSIKGKEHVLDALGAVLVAEQKKCFSES